MTMSDSGSRLGLLTLAMLGAALLSLMAGHQWLSPMDVWHAMWSPSATNVNDLLVRTTRLSRTLVAITVGASLGVAGGILQTLTRNPLAAPGILGINAGGLLAVIVTITLVSGAPGWLAPAAAFLGAALATAVIWWMAMRGPEQSGPLRLILAGAALTALFHAFSQAMLVVDQQGLDSMLFWLAGSLSGHSVADIWPLMLIASVALMGCGPWLRDWNVLAAGDSVAVGAGISLRRLQWVSVVLIVLLAGASVAMAGNIAFVGLIVPHIARRLLIADHRIWLPGAALIGATLLLLADIVGRLVILPGEVPIGVMTALVGAPIFLMLVRRQGRRPGQAGARSRGLS